MKKQITVAALLFCIYNCGAQTATAQKQVDTTVTIDTALTARDIDKAFKKVEIESKFPGGERAWINFLQENLTYPKKAVRKKVQGTVVLQFIVDRDGTVSDIEAISGPEELQQGAIDVLKKTPNWIPATQGGRKVKSYKKQPIVFRIE
jgi:protein TonB